MAKKGIEARDTFLGARQFRFIGINRALEEDYLVQLSGAVYRDLIQYGRCELIWRNDLIAAANANERSAMIKGMRDYFASDSYEKQMEAVKRELKNITDQKDEIEKEVVRLKAKKETLKSKVEHMESKYAIYKGADEITEAARQEAQVIKERSYSDAEAIRELAINEKTEIINRANNQAAGIVVEAEKKALDIREETKSDCERLRSEQIKKIDNLFPEFRTQIEEEYKRGIEDNRESQVRTALEMTNLRSRLEDDADSQRENFRQQQTDASSQIRDELTGCRNAISRELEELRNNYEEMLVRQANTFSEQIEAIARSIEEQRIARQNEISADIQEWKTEFYKMQYKELASVYRLFEESLRGAEKSEDKMLTDLLAEEEISEETPHREDLFREELHRRICNMKKLVSRLKNALAAVGIVEYVPEPGDKYDYDYHRCEDAEEGDHISAVKQNGMILKRKDEGDIVLLPADVEVDNGCN